MILNVKEDLHIHCNYNDHSSKDLTIPNIIAKSESLGLERIAITEHVRKNSEWTKDYINEINHYIPKTRLKILKGFEAKILVDGDIDCPSEFLNKDYFIIASFHTKYNKEVWYEGLIKAIRNPNVDVIGHLAPEIDFSIGESELKNIGDLIVANGKKIEINSKYIRPPKEFLKIFKKCGVKFHLGSDAHAIKDIGNFSRIKDLINVIEKK
ncbi:MAG TPA: PHP domain-containing protein [Candidatus Nitrosocosmicus sp.]|nr:PHP domain-containing protein [Candidatus Nitrosocosmicus sp.]